MGWSPPGCWCEERIQIIRKRYEHKRRVDQLLNDIDKMDREQKVQLRKFLDLDKEDQVE